MERKSKMYFESNVRKEIIPDVQMKMLELCLSDDENGIFMPSTKRKSQVSDFRADWALKDIISERIKNSQRPLPLALRKKKLYEESLYND